MIAFNEELVREVTFAYGIISHNQWSFSYVDHLLPEIMQHMINKGYVVNGAYAERALRGSIIRSLAAVDCE